MSSSSKTNRKGSSRPRDARKRSNPTNQPPSYDGVYGNPQLVHYFLNLMGSKCVVQVQNGSLYSGIFHTISPEMDLVLAAAHRVESNSIRGNSLSEDGIPSADKLIDELIFNMQDVVQLEVFDTNLSYAEVAVKSNGDAGTDTKNFSSANGSELRALEPWDGGGDSTSADAAIGGLEDGLGSNQYNGTNGWQAEDMFRTNLDKYGVKSSYNPDLPEYTTPLDTDNSVDYEKRKARASRIAQEIEGSSNYMKNVNLELDENTTEEEKFSSVGKEYVKYGRGRARPQRDPAREQRNQRPGGHTYPGPGNMSRPGYGPGGRANTPISSESTTSPPGQNKQFPPRQSSNMQSTLPPRFSRANSSHQRDYDCDADRGGRAHIDRGHDNVQHHPYAGPPKPMRQNPQGRSSFPKTSPHQDYNQPAVDSAIPGQTTPQSLSRDSSTSSLTQQAAPPPQWKESERMQVSMPPNPNQPQIRSFPSAHNRGERCRSHPVQKVQVIPRILGRSSRITMKPGEEIPYNNPLAQQPPAANMPGHGMPPPTGSYADKGPKHPSQAYRPALPGKGPKSQQATKMYPASKGLPTPMALQTASHPGISQRHQQQQRYPVPVATMPPGGPPPPGSNMRRTAAPPTDSSSKPSVLKKNASNSSSLSAPLSKSGSTGSDLKILQDFSKNFNLQLSDGPPSEVHVEAKPNGSAGAPRSKSMDETSSNRVMIASKSPRIASSNQGPTAVADTSLPPKPAVALSNPGAIETVEISTAMPSVLPTLPPTPQQLAAMHGPGSGWQPPVTIKTPPASPAINVPSPRAATTASDVVTVSASGQYVTSGVDGAAALAAAAQKVPSSEVAHVAPPSDLTTTPSAGEPGNPPTADLNKQNAMQLNPNAEEFTPRSFAPKSGGISTPRSPTPVAPPQPIPSAYYNPAAGQIYVLPPKASKQGQTILSPSPSEPHVVGVNPHLNPTSVPHHIIPHPYHHTPGPLVFTQGPTASHQLAAGQPALMHQQATYTNMEQMVYNPQASHHLMQPTARAIPAGYPAEYGYQTAQSIHIQQQQHPSQHQGQQTTPHQQQGQPSQPSNYMAQQPQQQPQQQQRPHSAHTPNTAQIPPASPASNVQPMSVTMSVNPVQVQNPVIAPHSGYYQQPLLAAHPPMHAAPVHPVTNSPHAPYHGVAPRGPGYMVVSGTQQIPPNASGQHTYMQPAVVSSANHGQPQYSSARQYHGQPVIQSYQQAPN